MTIVFKLLSEQEFRERTKGMDPPHTYNFILMKRDEEVGLYGITDRGNSTGEIHLEIRDEYKYKIISKNILLEIIDYPFSLGFSMVIGYTEIKSFARLLTLFQKYGIKKINKEYHGGQRTWFYKQGK